MEHCYNSAQNEVLDLTNKFLSPDCVGVQLQFTHFRYNIFFWGSVYVVTVFQRIRSQTMDFFSFIEFHHEWSKYFLKFFLIIQWLIKTWVSPISALTAIVLNLISIRKFWIEVRFSILLGRFSHRQSLILVNFPYCFETLKPDKTNSRQKLDIMNEFESPDLSAPIHLRIPIQRNSDLTIKIITTEPFVISRFYG